MELLKSGYTLELSDFPLSTDSLALAEFVKLPKDAAVLDLGSGCGTLGLLLCGKSDTCHVTGIEIDESAHKVALRNIHNNRLEGRMESFCADLRELARSREKYRVCVSNPPYFSGGAQSASAPTARHDDLCTTEELIAAAARSLRYGGDFYLVHRPERLAQICAVASANNLQPKRLRLLRHRTDGEVTLILLQCRKGAAPGLKWEEVSLYNADGTPTRYGQSL